MIFLNSETKQPIENVTALLYQKSKVTNVFRSDYEGMISFNKLVPRDSVVIYRLGYFKAVLIDQLSTNTIFLKPNQSQIDEVIITGQIVPGNKYQSPFKLRYFTEEEIKAKKSNNLAEFLQTENNFSISQDPILGTKVAINGMSGSDLKVLIDGVPVIGRINGNLDFSQILLNNIARIEVVDGPLSAIYGTNATGGVINLISKTGSNNKSDINGYLYAESVGVMNVNANYNLNTGGSKFNFGAGRNVFLGWDPNFDSLSRVVKPIFRDVAWNPKEQYFFNTAFYRDLSRKVKLNIKSNVFFERIINKLNPVSDQQVIVFDEYYNTKKGTLSASINTIFNKNLELQSTINYNLFNRNVRYYSQDLTNGTQQYLRDINESIHNFFYRSILKQDFYDKSVKILYGIDYNMDIGNSQRLVNTTAMQFDLGLFAMFNFKFSEKLFFQPGFRYSINNISNIPMAPTINFRYELHPQISTRFSYTRGYRLPDIKELYFTFIDNNHNILGNQNLHTEINDNFQFGIDIKPNKVHKNLMSYSTSFTSSFYFKQDAIDIVPSATTTNEFLYLNVGYINGMIFNIDNRIKYKTALLSFGSTLGAIQKKYNNVVNQQNMFNLNGTINCNFIYEIPKYELKLSFLNKFNFKNNYTVYNLVKNDVEISSYPAYMYSDFNISKPFLNNKLQLTVGVKNIFNIKNLKIVGYSGNIHNFSNTNDISQLWGRTAFMSVNFNFDKF